MANIHPTAIIDPKAELDVDVEVGPYAIIGPDVKIGTGTVVQTHAYVGGHTTIGKACQIFPFACVGTKSQDLKYHDGDITYVEIGERTVLREFSTVHMGTKPGEITRVGKGCLIMAYCHIAHGCTVGDEVIMSNATTLGGEVIIEDFAIVGGLVGIHQFCRIGTHAMIGGFTKLRQDCPPYMITENCGEEIRVLGPNIVGMQRRGFSPEVRTALKEAYKLMYREGLNRSQALERIKLEVTDIPEVKIFIDFYLNSKRGVF